MRGDIGIMEKKTETIITGYKCDHSGTRIMMKHHSCVGNTYWRSLNAEDLFLL